MLAFVRAGFAAALVLLLSVPAFAADKPFQRDDLADAAIKLEAQIKAEAGQVSKPAAALRREADAAFQRNDFRTGMQILGQIVTVAPDDSANWLRLARTVLQIRPGNDRERTPLLERAATAAYIAYQRTEIAGEEADSLDRVGAASPTAQSGGRRSMRCGSRSTCARSPTCASNTSACARITASACSTTRSMPTPPRRAPASSSPRTCRASAPTSRRSSPSPARTSPALSVEDKPALRRGPQARRALHHHAARRHSLDGEGDAGEVRRVQHLCARPQAVGALHRQGLCAAAHRPARHSGGQRQHRGGGARGLPHRRPQPDRRPCSATTSSATSTATTSTALTEERGSQVWKGEMKVEQTLNADVTTAFPVDQADRRRLRPASMSWWRSPPAPIGE